MKRRSIVLAAAATLLGGCAATVHKGPATPDSMARKSPEARQRIVLNVTGSPRAEGAGDWQAFKGVWAEAFRTRAAAMGMPFDVQAGPPAPTGQPGTLLQVFVDDYRYVSTGARFGLGVMTGNAYVQARIRFVDLRTGDLRYEQLVNTSSSAMQGIFSAMTPRQLEAIAADVLDEVSRQSARRRGAPGPLLG